MATHKRKKRRRTVTRRSESYPLRVAVRLDSGHSSNLPLLNQQTARKSNSEGQTSQGPLRGSGSFVLCYFFAGGVPYVAHARIITV